MSTSIEDSNILRDVLEAGASDFVSKPIRWQLLGSRVRYLLHAGEKLAKVCRSREALVTAQRIAGVGSWEWRSDTKETRWSELTFEILGVESRTTPSYDCFWRCVHDEDRDLAREEFEAAIEAHSRLSARYRVVHPSGLVRYVELRGGPIYDSEAASGQCPWRARSLPHYGKAPAPADSPKGLLSSDLRPGSLGLLSLSA